MTFVSVRKDAEDRTAGQDNEETPGEGGHARATRAHPRDRMLAALTGITARSRARVSEDGAEARRLWADGAGPPAEVVAAALAADVPLAERVWLLLVAFPVSFVAHALAWLLARWDRGLITLVVLTVLVLTRGGGA